MDVDIYREPQTFTAICIAPFDNTEKEFGDRSNRPHYHDEVG